MKPGSKFNGEAYEIIHEDKETVTVIMPRSKFECLQTLINSKVIDFITEIRLAN